MIRFLRPLLPMLATLGLLCSYEHAAAQLTPGIIGDRPSQLAPVSGPGTVQFGTGLAYEASKGAAPVDPSSNVVVLGMLMRTGLTEKAELRIGFEYANETEHTPLEAAHLKGLRNISIGAKLELLEQDGAIPALSLFANTRLPFGQDSYRPQAMIPGVQIQADYDLDQQVMLTGNIGGECLMGSRELLTTFTTTVAVPLTTWIAAFGDLTGEYAPSAAPAHVCDLGLTFALHDHLQLDFAYGRGLTGGAPDYFLNSGFSYRIH